MLNAIDPKKDYTQAVIVVPTRELALQNSAVVKKLGKHLDVNVIVCTGGTILKDDIIRLMRAVHIIVATPGRLVDLAGRRAANLSKVSLFVMDEADKVRESIPSDDFAYFVLCLVHMLRSSVLQICVMKLCACMYFIITTFTASVTGVHRGLGDPTEPYP